MSAIEKMRLSRCWQQLAENQPFELVAFERPSGRFAPALKAELATGEVIIADSTLARTWYNAAKSAKHPTMVARLNIAVETLRVFTDANRRALQQFDWPEVFDLEKIIVDRSKRSATPVV